MIEDKIEKIVNKYAYNEIHDPDGKFSVTSGWCYDKKLIKELSTLIQAERKEAVRGLIEYLEANTEKVFYLGCGRIATEYLEIVEREKK